MLAPLWKGPNRKSRSSEKVTKVSGAKVSREDGCPCNVFVYFLFRSSVTEEVWEDDGDSDTSPPAPRGGGVAILPSGTMEAGPRKARRSESLAGYKEWRSGQGSQATSASAEVGQRGYGQKKQEQRW